MVTGLLLVAMSSPSAADAAKPVSVFAPSGCGAFAARNGTRITVSAAAAPCAVAVKIVKAFYNGTAQQTTVEYGSPSLGYQIDVRLQGFPGWLCHQSTGAGFCFKGQEHAYYSEGPEGGGSARPSSAPRECGSSPLAVQDLWHVSLARACTVWQAAVQHRLSRCVGEKPNQAFTPGAYPVLVRHSFDGWRITLNHGALQFSRKGSSFIGGGSDAPPYPC